MPSLKKKEIIEGSLKLFSKKGIVGVNVTEIIESIGVSRRTFYKYFDSKEDLLNEFKKVKQFIPFEKYFLQNYHNFFTLSPKTQLELFIENMFQMLNSPSQWENLFFHILLSPSLRTFFKLDVKEYFNSGVQFLSQILAKLEVNYPKKKARTLFVLLDGAFLDKYICEINDIDIDTKEWIEDIYFIVKESLNRLLNEDYKSELKKKK